MIKKITVAVVKTALQLFDAAKKLTKKDFLGKCVDGLTLDELYDFSKANKGMDIPVNQLLTAKITPILFEKFKNGEKPKTIVKNFKYCSSRQVYNIYDLYNLKNPKI